MPALGTIAPSAHHFGARIKLSGNTTLSSPVVTVDLALNPHTAPADRIDLCTVDLNGHA